MKQKLIMTKGLPASGKSTWAKEQVEKSGGKIKRVNMDDLRNMIDAGKFSKERENEIQTIQERLVAEYLITRRTIIVDNTHLAPKWESKWRELANDYDVEFEIKDFTDVGYKTCVERDAKRENPVGKKVIMDITERKGEQALFP